MAQGMAYWISPGGKVIGVVTSHIAAVIADPKSFNMTTNEIESVYAHHGERIGLEGYAREQILKDLLRRRWIRIREHRTHWSVQFSTASPRTRVYIRAWTRGALRRAIIGDRYAALQLDGIVDGYSKHIEMGELAKCPSFEVEGAERWQLRWCPAASRPPRIGRH